MLEKAKKGGFTKSLQIGMHHVDLTHVQFMDDIILFCPANEEVLLNYVRILNYFGVMLGLKINYDKSTFIPFKCEEEWVENMRRKLCCMVASLWIKYLGIPLGANPKRLETWRPIIEKIEKKLNNWKASLISQPRRLTLIKSILIVFLCTIWGSFKCQELWLQKLSHYKLNSFGGAKGGKNGIRTVKWNTIKLPKEAGGLGVGSILMKM